MSSSQINPDNLNLVFYKQPTQDVNQSKSTGRGFSVKNDPSISELPAHTATIHQWKKMDWKEKVATALTGLGLLGEKHQYMKLHQNVGNNKTKVVGYVKVSELREGVKKATDNDKIGNFFRLQEKIQELKNSIFIANVETEKVDIQPSQHVKSNSPNTPTELGNPNAKTFTEYSDSDFARDKMYQEISGYKDEYKESITEQDKSYQAIHLFKLLSVSENAKLIETEKLNDLLKSEIFTTLIQHEETEDSNSLTPLAILINSRETLLSKLNNNDPVRAVEENNINILKKYMEIRAKQAVIHAIKNSPRPPSAAPHAATNDEKEYDQLVINLSKLRFPDEVRESMIVPGSEDDIQFPK